MMRSPALTAAGGFNLATTSASWRTRTFWRWPAAPRRFNLATTSASWRTIRADGTSTASIGLQFGHDVSVVENIRPTVGRTVLYLLQFGHDVSVVENVRPSPITRSSIGSFNLATTSASWRTRTCSPARPGTAACFNLATTSASWRTVALGVYRVVLPVLQFGHDVSVVENIVAGDRASFDTQLQFGHDVSVVENVEARHPGRPVPRGFNLATTSASWRTLSRGTSPRRTRRFNLATTSASWRTLRLEGESIGADLASIWPRRQRRGERDDAVGTVAPKEASIWPRRQRRGELNL